MCLIYLICVVCFVCSIYSCFVYLICFICFICLLLHLRRSGPIIGALWTRFGPILDTSGRGQENRETKKLLTLGIPRGFFFEFLTPNFSVGIFCFFLEQKDFWVGIFCFFLTNFSENRLVLF